MEKVPPELGLEWHCRQRDQCKQRPRDNKEKENWHEEATEAREREAIPAETAGDAKGVGGRSQRTPCVQRPSLLLGGEEPRRGLSVPQRGQRPARCPGRSRGSIW